MKNLQIHQQEKMIMELEKQVSCPFSYRGHITEVIKEKFGYSRWT